MLYLGRAIELLDAEGFKLMLLLNIELSVVECCIVLFGELMALICCFIKEIDNFLLFFMFIFFFYFSAVGYSTLDCSSVISEFIFYLLNKMLY